MAMLVARIVLTQMLRLGSLGSAALYSGTILQFP